MYPEMLGDLLFIAGGVMIALFIAIPRRRVGFLNAE